MRRAPRTPYRTLALLLTWLGAVWWSACADSGAGTSVRVLLVYEDSWRMAGADVLVSGRQASAPLQRELLVLLPDEMANGDPQQLEVWGVRDGERIAHGSAVAVPKKGETVDATVVLERDPCGAFCSPGDVQCAGNGIETCSADDDGCMVWSAPQACDSTAPFCVDGACSTRCVDECGGSQTRCQDADTQQRCGESDGDPCKEYGPPTDCAGGELCYGGRCAARCAFGALGSTALPDSPDPQGPSIAFDTRGEAHAIYSVNGSSVLRYAMRNGSSWTWTTIGATGRSPSLAVDTAGALHVVFSDVTTAPFGIKYGVRRPSQGWMFETIRTGAVVGQWSSLVIDKSGTPHVIFADTSTGDLWYARRGTSTGWTAERVAAGGQGCDLLVDATGAVHASYYSASNDIMYARRAPAGGWTTEIALAYDVSTVPAHAETSIVRTRAGTLYVAASDVTYSFFTGTRYTLKLLDRGTRWDFTTIDDDGYFTGGSPDLALDPFDGLHVVYRTLGTTPSLRYGVRAGSTWTLSTQTSRGYEPSIAVADDGRVLALSASRSASLVETSRACTVP